MKILPLLGVILFCSSLTCTAQNEGYGMIAAEKAFAAYAEAHSVRDAFLYYMDSTGIVFRQGKAINAREAYRNQPTGQGLLKWTPDFAVISASGDMGITAGPYQFFEKRGSDTVSGYGHFSSVWQKNKSGEWKNKADLGIQYGSKNTLQTGIRSELVAAGNTINTTWNDILQTDGLFNKAMARNEAESIQHFFSVKARFMIDGFEPFDGKAAIASGLQHLPAGLVAETMNGELSAAKDFAYVYGSVVNGNKKGNYLRAWVLENKEWKLVLQSLHW